MGVVKKMLVEIFDDQFVQRMMKEILMGDMHLFPAVCDFCMSMPLHDLKILSMWMICWTVEYGGKWKDFQNWQAFQWL